MKFSDRQRGYQVEVLVDGVPAPTFEHEGESYVLGSPGQEYTLRIHNRSPRRVEAVASIDGLDVIDGRPAGYAKRGYIIPAWGSVEIDGWRLSTHEAATFRFSSVAASYAASKGKARNVGVIGVAIFPERVFHPRPQPLYRPLPHPDRYSLEDARGEAGNAADESRPARSARQLSDDQGAAAEAAGAPSSAAPPMANSEARAAERDLRDQPLGGRWREREHARRPGLGTEFGAAINSPVYEVAFQRDNARTPEVILGVRYNDREGLLAMGVPVYPSHYSYSDAELRKSAHPFPISTRQYALPPRHWNGR